MFCFRGKCCFADVSHPQQLSTETSSTVFWIKVEVPTKYPLGHNDRIVVSEIRFYSEGALFC
jgi:hypothetical protein